MKQNSEPFPDSSFSIASIGDLHSLVPEVLPQDEKDQVAFAFSVGGIFDVNIFISQPDALQYLHPMGSILALPFVVVAARTKPLEAASLVCAYLLRYGFSKPFTDADNLPLFFPYSPVEFRLKYKMERQAIVGSLSAENRRSIGLDFHRIATSLSTIDSEEVRILKKTRRWLSGVSAISV